MYGQSVDCRIKKLSAVRAALMAAVSEVWGGLDEGERSQWDRFEEHLDEKIAEMKGPMRRTEVCDLEALQESLPPVAVPLRHVPACAAALGAAAGTVEDGQLADCARRATLAALSALDAESEAIQAVPATEPYPPLPAGCVPFPRRHNPLLAVALMWRLGEQDAPDAAEARAALAALEAATDEAASSAHD
jgi:hypothetical protein